MGKGFITEDEYAAVPYGKQYIIIFNGEQLELCKTLSSAKKFIERHRTTPKKGTIFVN